MRRTLAAGLLAGLALQAVAAEPPVSADPYLWLEDVGGDKALDWVRTQNAATLKQLQADPGYEPLRRDIKAILDSEDKIPDVHQMGGHWYNFWKDAAHPRGVWRRTTPDEYRKAQPTWEVLLDLDALNQAENENWVWHGAECLRPAAGQPWTRCLVALSRGGSDADVTREFDLGSKAFVKDGFFRPEAKGALSWISQDRVYVYSDFGEGSLTESGYPRVVKEWRRGTPLAEAHTVYQGQKDDLYIAARHDDTPGYERDFVIRSLAFYNEELYLRGADGALTKLDLPNSADKSVEREWLLVQLREAWNAGGQEYAAGSLLAIRFKDFMAGQRGFTLLFKPDARSSLQGVSWTRNHLLINVLQDVKSRLFMLTPQDKGWKRAPLPGAPSIGSVSVGGVDADESDDYFMLVTGYLTPSTLFHGRVGEKPKALKSAPAFFDAKGLEVKQYFAVSRDGTKVPYFLVSKKKLELDGRNPTLLYGYGGFEISLTPGYSPGVGRGWLTQGGVYAVANIRGGGEYGPRWHQAALKQNRLRAFEDFAAVAQDLIARKITTPKHLGIQGGSNGGLLVGNMLTQYPQLLGAVVCQVPLLDMQRYHKLLAGASWMAEYGDPDDPAQWDYIKTFSPYQNLLKDADYPPVLFMTSTRDDRVHPGHARKMMARMLEQGHAALYYENIEGGHGGAADNDQLATMQALAYTFLRQRLKDAK
ncbi:prolyl oligopeptidase family protein [Solimonas sp. SE-A11]|uniref:prolyl oligopeptidase family serine peptidase n=1 Tax=Solimonas sp. SE-A11 TaxID=3054954 RepID=UPI00259D034D|nr:prolyl oligopeptidase family serine peptidase [Solimonas sp. SE-A11]MDM4772371.1 prolyl oligopeptidase family serine peptidase [Solimonas sp. SE-A11]